MEFFQYTKLFKHEQWDLLFRNGEFIGSKTHSESKFVLYKLYNFYVEVEYFASENKIRTMKCFQNFNESS